MTVQLMGNGEAVTTAEVDHEGQFNFKTNFIEGDNQFVVTLDTIPPEFAIDYPRNGDHTDC